MPEGRRTPPWGTFAITLVLLVVVLWLIKLGNYPGLAGSLLGYICGYWLPTRPAPPTEEHHG